VRKRLRTYSSAHTTERRARQYNHIWHTDAGESQVPGGYGSSAKLTGKVVSAPALGRAAAVQLSHAEHPLLRLQRQYGNRYVQRVMAQGKKADDRGEATPDLERTIERARGGGQALDSEVRAQMEPALGADFGGVRVHTDAQADRLNRSLNARTFTTGQDIFFRQGDYKPGTFIGRDLLAHELTHVVQQTSAKLTHQFGHSTRHATAVHKRQQKNTPNTLIEQTEKDVKSAKLSDSVITSSDDTSLPAQAARLTNVHFQTAQRQAMANQIGRVGGNRYLQKVIAQIGQEEREKKLPGAEEFPEAIQQDELSFSENLLHTSMPPLRRIDDKAIQRAIVEGYNSPADWAAHLDSLSANELVAERRRRWDHHLKGLVERTLDHDTLEQHTRMREGLENVMRPWAEQIAAVQGDHDARLAVVQGAVTGVARFVLGKIPVIGPILSIGFGVAANAFAQATPTIGDLPDAALNAFTEQPNQEQNEEEQRILRRLGEVAIEQLPNATFADLYYNDTRANQRSTFGIQELTREDFERKFFESTAIRSWVAEKAAGILQSYQQNVLISEGRVPRRGERWPAGAGSGIWRLRATSSEWVAEIESAYGDRYISTDYLVTEDESPVPHRFPLSGGFQDVWDVVHGRYRGQRLLAGRPSEVYGIRQSAPRRLANDHPVGAIILIRTGGLGFGSQRAVTDQGRILRILRIIDPDLAGIPNFARASAALTREFADATLNTTMMEMMREGALVYIELSTYDTGQSENRSPIGFEVRRNFMPITNLSSDQMRQLRQLVQ
jgi:hypothetical protein